MWSLIMRLFGRRIVHKAVAKQVRGGGLDARLGFSLFRDGRIPLKAKALALGLGAAIMAVIIGAEIPLEGLWSLLLPFSLPVEMLADGLEAVIGPLMVAALALPFLAPRSMVDLIRAERAGLAGQIIDVESI